MLREILEDSQESQTADGRFFIAEVSSPEPQSEATTTEQAKYLGNLTTLEGRAGLRLPSYEFSEDTEPSGNVLNFFNSLWTSNGLPSGSGKPYQNELWLPAESGRSALVLRGRFTGISTHTVVERHRYLETYRGLKASLEAKERELKTLKNLADQGITTDYVVENLGPVIENLKLQMGRIVSSNSEDQGIVPDYGGVRGLENHEIVSPPTEKIGRPTVIVRVSQQHTLPEESERFNLPRFKDGGLIQFKRYPYKKPEYQHTNLWFEGQEMIVGHQTIDNLAEQQLVSKAILESIVAMLS